MRRIVVVLVLLLGTTVWPAAGGLAASTSTPATAVEGLQADFNDDGFADLAVGVVSENLGAISNGGAVNVLYGSATGLTGAGSQLFTQDSSGVPGVAEPGDGFGDALAVGDFDGDGFADLAVGVSLEDVGAVVDAGAVNVLYGTAGGLSGGGSQLFTQDSPGVGSSAETEDNFGQVLAAGNFDGDRFADLTVGIWRENVGATVNGGAATVLYGTAAGLTGPGSRFLTQDSPGVPGVVERDDEFGFAVGAGDVDGDGFTDLAVGAPGEDYGAADRGGAVNLLPGSAGGLSGSGSQLFTRESPGVPGSAQGSDGFGFISLAAGDFDSDGAADLAVGVSELPAIPGAGALVALPGSAGGLTGIGSMLFSQDSPGVPDSAEFRDQFGSALAAGDFDADSFVDLAAGVLGETVDAFEFAGAVNVVPGSAGGLTGTGSQLFTQDSPGVPDSVEFDDFLGEALAASGP
jgi:FG-GAP repeat